MLKPAFQRPVLKYVSEFQDALVAWFVVEAKDYPWRRTQDPYAILVSEVMLQQTQIATVLGRSYYSRFLASFPSVAELSVAEDEALLKAWEGLGYYRRVRMLRETARAVIADYDGDFPTERATLMKLPGVGRYTAGALRAFAFNLPAAVVDGNVARLFARLMAFSGPVDDTSGIKKLWEWAEALADPERPRIYHAALMELGQRICRPGLPDCMNCPVARFCETREPEFLPIKRNKVAITAVDEHAVWLRDAKGRLLLHLEGGKRRQGLWKLPTREAAILPGLPILTEECYTITRYRVRLIVHDGANISGDFQVQVDEVWQEPQAILALPMPSPFRRVIQRLLSET